MKIILPILLILGTFYSWYMTAYYLWQASYHSEHERAVAVCLVWGYVFACLLVVSLLAWIAYGIALWRRKGYGLLSLVYVSLNVLLYGVGWFVVGKMLSE